MKESPESKAYKKHPYEEDYGELNGKKMHLFLGLSSKIQNLAGYDLVRWHVPETSKSPTTDLQTFGSRLWNTLTMLSLHACLFSYILLKCTHKMDLQATEKQIK